MFAAKALINNRYQPSERPIRGDDVYLGTDVVTGEEVEMKFAELSVLENEAFVHKVVAGVVGIPSLHWFGSTENHYVLVTSLLGPSLAEVQNHCRGRLSLKTVLFIFDQILPCLESLHKRSYTHGNINTDNIRVGLGKQGCIFSLTGLSHAKAFPQPQGKCIGSTSPYASINAHRGTPPSPSDDYESLAYTILEVLRGSLPWEDCGDVDSLILQKTSIAPGTLFDGCPVEFSEYLTYVKSPAFGELPDYQLLRKPFQDYFASNFLNDYIFDWTIYKYHPHQLEANSARPGVIDQVETPRMSSEQLSREIQG